MTEKRYWYDFEDCTGHKMVDFIEDKEYPLETVGDFREIENLLNTQYMENIKLKKIIKCLREENEEFNEELLEYDTFKKFSNEKIRRLEKDNAELKGINKFKLETDRNGYYICNGVSCPICSSQLEECREVAYGNGEVYKEFDCTNCEFTGRLRKVNLYDGSA